MSESSVCHLMHFVMRGGQEDELASRLIDLVAHTARNSGAVMLAAQTTRDSNIYRLLLSCGFRVDWEEADAANGRVVTVAHLLKNLES
jgi:hypothetical protein